MTTDPFEYKEPGVNFPALVKMNVNTDGVRLHVREHARIEHSENGGHYAMGHEADVHIPRDEALRMAFSIIQSYGWSAFKTGVAYFGFPESRPPKSEQPQRDVRKIVASLDAGRTIDEALSDALVAEAEIRDAEDRIPGHLHLGHGFDVVSDQSVPHVRDSDITMPNGPHGDEDDHGNNGC